MKISLQTKLLGLCIFLVLLTTIGVSVTYYVLTRQDKQRESQQRIQIAFDFMLDDFQERLNAYTARFEEFLKEKNNTLFGTTALYNQDKSLINSATFLSSLRRATGELKKFGGVLAVDRLFLYGEDKRLLAAYQRQGDQETVGGYLIAETGHNTYLPLDDAALVTPIMLGSKPIPEMPLPADITATYAGDIPDKITVRVFNDGQKLGIRSIAPIFQGEHIAGVLVGEAVYPQAVVERLALLSKTAINMFAGHQLSIGMLPSQAELAPEDLQQFASCENILSGSQNIEVIPLIFDKQGYYQGQCVFEDVHGETVGALTISLSQEIEKREVKKILTTVVIVAVLVSGLAFALTVVASRKSVHLLQTIITSIDQVARGDIPDPITGEYKGEFNDIKHNLNGLIEATHHTTRVAEEIALGKMQTAIPERSENDRLMRALNAMILSLNQVARVTEAIARGDLTITVQERSQDDTIMQALSYMHRQLTQVAWAVTDAVNTIVKSSQELSDSAEALSQGTSQQAAATEEASSSMQEMTANIRQNAENARQTETLASQAVSYAEETGAVVAEAVVAMQQIANQISVIQDIAQQTRLLSLNATIEASRAQDYGKAFAVVAHEVRDLANTTRTAAETIVELTHSSLDVSQKAGAMLATLVPNIQKTAELVQDISAASAEQSSGAEQVNKAIQQLDQVTQENATTAEQVASSAEMLANQASQLQQTIAFFTIPEQPAETATADHDLLIALQTLAAKGANEQALGALVKSMLPAPLPVSAVSERHDGAPAPATLPQEPALAIPVALKADRDRLDDEFEHY